MTQEVDQALITAILDGELEIDVVHENGVYSVWNGAVYKHLTGVYIPENNREFCEVRNFPASRTALSLAHSDQETGIFQIILKYPSDVGAHTIKAKAELIIDLFVIGESVSYINQDYTPVTQEVYVESKTRDGGRQQGGFYQIVIRINYYAFVSR